MKTLGIRPLLYSLLAVVFGAVFGSPFVALTQPRANTEHLSRSRRPRRKKLRELYRTPGLSSMSALARN
jgi:hypothetical protein